MFVGPLGPVVVGPLGPMVVPLAPVCPTHPVAQKDVLGFTHIHIIKLPNYFAIKIGSTIVTCTI